MPTLPIFICWNSVQEPLTFLASWPTFYCITYASRRVLIISHVLKRYWHRLHDIGIYSDYKRSFFCKLSISWTPFPKSWCWQFVPDRKSPWGFTFPLSRSKVMCIHFNCDSGSFQTSSETGRKSGRNSIVGLSGLVMTFPVITPRSVL